MKAINRFFPFNVCPPLLFFVPPVLFALLGRGGGSFKAAAPIGVGGQKENALRWCFENSAGMQSLKYDFIQAETKDEAMEWRIFEGNILSSSSVHSDEHTNVI